MDKAVIKIKCASPKIRLGDVCHNASLIIDEIKNADKTGVQVLLFPELCLCGYTLRDMLASPVIADACRRELVRIANATKGTGVVAFVGTVYQYGDKLYNAVAIVERGIIGGIVPKASFAKRCPFGENRVFDVPTADFEIIDDFNTQLLFGTEIIYSLPNGVRLGTVVGSSREKVSSLVKKGAEVILNPTAQPVTVTMENDRVRVAQELSFENKCAVVMCNASMGESTTDALLAPHTVIAQNGRIAYSSELFNEKTADPVCEIDTNLKEMCEPKRRELKEKNSPYPFVLDDKEEMKKRCALISDIQAHALALRLEATYSKSMVVGISGGLDSTLALLVMAKSADILGWDRKRIVAITMPCFGTTQRTKGNATKLCTELGVTLREINIFEATRIHLRDIGHDESIKNVAYENAQARERTQILMDVANDIGGIVVGTGDLSEVALGWATYNGDHMAMYNVNSDIPKTLVRHVVGYFAKEAERSVAEILYDILDTPVSPELLPANENGEIEQKTEDLVGPYELHDYFIYNFAGRGYAPSQIYRLAKEAFSTKFDAEVIYKWLTVFLKRFVTQQFKRSASPEGIKVGSVSLSPRGDFSAPSDMSYQVFLDELETVR